MIDYGKFQKLLKHLELQYENFRSMGEEQSQLMQEAVAESTIQRFETCYDCMWKVLKRYLAEQMGLPDVPNSPKPILRIAAENQLLPSETEKWIHYANMRTSTAHDYSGEKAEAALDQMGAFIAESIQLYTELTGKAWEL
jgi:nucleotidyltransferase substrate binding protein (TIGR01987 family)